MDTAPATPLPFACEPGFSQRLAALRVLTGGEEREIAGWISHTLYFYGRRMIIVFPPKSGMLDAEPPPEHLFTELLTDSTPAMFYALPVAAVPAAEKACQTASRSFYSDGLYNTFVRQAKPTELTSPVVEVGTLHPDEVQVVAEMWPVSKVFCFSCLLI
eukprot:gnl/TRDRNA2_/TRDRNA2_128101_c0_seq2.p1 gnl/TRDRNA2_/TRDRNA2_128101_c0~~gnl/TRDRNA2_/TRDRNA2_128101_c0_seq2.p1  ORF type:complete len:159 (+),score=25.08 gnl/TRDRNA2_/TRDRNA2_128101_c0_seq2:3-479(+)